MKADLVKAVRPEFGNRYVRVKRLRSSSIAEHGVRTSFSPTRSGMQVKSEVINEAKRAATKPGNGTWLLVGNSSVMVLAPKRNLFKIVLAALNLGK